MSGTNYSREKHAIESWAAGSMKSFSAIDREAESYWEDKEDTVYATEYSFYTLQQFTELCEKLCDMENNLSSIRKYVQVAAMKGRPKENEETSNDAQEQAYMPDYIYRMM